MKINKKLMVIFLLVFLFRLYFAFQTNYFSDDTSYSYIRQMDYIKDNYKPMSYDELSYGGRQILPSPLFPYILYIFSLVPFGLKIIPQLIISLIVFVAYLLSREMVDDENSALFSATLTGFMPLLIGETLNKISIYFIAVPIIFYLIYCLTNISKRKNKMGFLFSLIIISLLDPIFIILSLVLLFYLLLLYVEDMEIPKPDLKITIASIFIVILINLILLKDVIFTYGFSVIYRNVPKELLVNAFKQIDVLTLIYNIGYIPLIFGGVSIYYGITRQKTKIIFLLSSLIFVTFSLLALKLMAFYSGLILIGVSASILSAIAVNKLFKYLDLTKLSKYNYLFIPLFLLLIILLSVYPSYSISEKSISDVPSDNEIRSLEWINSDSDKNDVVLGTIYQGNIISEFSGRKNVFDTYFLFAPDVSQRITDAYTIFNANYDRVSPLLKKYNIKYIFLSNQVQDLYGIKTIKYANSTCLEKHDIVYKVVC